MSLYQQHIQQLQQRFDNAMSQSQLDGVLIYSGQQAYAFLDDNALPFKVNPYFKYWLPLTNQQKSFILVRPAQKPHLFLFQEQDYWHAQPKIPEGEWQDYFELTVTEDASHVLKLLEQQKSKIAIIAENQQANDLFHDWPQQQLNPKRLLDELDYYRAYKSDYEVANMRIANAMAAKAHIAAKKTFFDGGTELQIHQSYLDALETRESNLPYNNIIAFNQNASILHYDDYQSVAPVDRRTFLIDAGAQYQGYNADISRTYINESVAGAHDFIALFNAYKELYFALLDDIQINKSFVELHDKAHRGIAKLLSDFEMINCSPEETHTKGYSQLFFPCGTGHYIGAQVHDVGGQLANANGEKLKPDERYPFLRLLRPIENHTVFTIEPGIYFIDQLLNKERGNPDFNWQQINAFQAFGGFRLEDCISVTEKGIENLSIDGFNSLPTR